MSTARLARVDPLVASLATGVGGVVSWLAAVGLLTPVGYRFLVVVACLLAVQGAIVVSVYRYEVDGPTSFTIPTAITVFRGAAIAVLAGFLLTSPEGLVVWVPAILYAAVAGLDAVDGFLARLTGTASAIGARLDTEMDALGLLVGAAVAITIGMAPIVYLLVGLARYGFVAGLTVRRRLGRPISELPESRLRRVNAAAQMAVVILLLAPWPGPDTSRILALVAMVPFLLVFVRDWLLATDRREGPVW